MEQSSWWPKYKQHEANANYRGIPFWLTFEEWCSLWEASGKWKQRGAHKGQYVMARPGDRGAYEIGNVIICRAEDNRAERNRNYPMVFNEKQLLARSKIMRGKSKSKTMRAALAKTATGRRLVTRNGRSSWAHVGDADYPSANGSY